MSQKNSIPPEGPGQAQIEALLESFRPQPGEPFYRRMADAPWTRKGVHRVQSVSRQSLSRVLTVSAFALVLLGCVAVATPQGQTLVRTIARSVVPDKNGLAVPPTQENQPPTELLESQLAPTETLQAVEQIAFEVCGESSTWMRPSEEEQKSKWWDFGRYAGADEKVIKYPWTHDFFVAYGSASIEYDIINLSGLWTLPGNVRDNCLGSDRQEAIVALKTAEVWVLLHTVKNVYRTGADYYLVVEPAETGVQFVQFSRTEQHVPLTFHFVTEGSQEVEKIAEAESPYWPYPQLALSATPLASTSTPAPLTFSLTVGEAEALAGFDVLAPSYLPTGYAFQGAHYDSETQRVAMSFVSQRGESGGAGTLYIYQQRGSLPEDTSPSAAVTAVSVGDVMGKFVRGAWVYEPAGSTTPRWEGNADVYTLSWQKNNTTFTITFLGGETIPPISLDDLRAIAESMK